MPRVLIDETGHRYGRLVALAIGGISSRGDRLWVCLCDCQAKLPEATRRTTLVAGGNLRRGITRSCGCLRREASRARMAEIRERLAAQRAALASALTAGALRPALLTGDRG